MQQALGRLESVRVLSYPAFLIGGRAETRGHAPMLTLGLSSMRDAAAALVENGRVIAEAQEEQFVRVKHVTALPVQAIR